MKLPVVKCRFLEETSTSDERQRNLLYCIAVYIIQGYCYPLLPIGAVATGAVKLIDTSFAYCLCQVAIKTQGDFIHADNAREMYWQTR